jgi:hypothetical protein
VLGDCVPIWLHHILNTHSDLKRWGHIPPKCGQHSSLLLSVKCKMNEVVGNGVFCIKWSCFQMPLQHLTVQQKMILIYYTDQLILCTGSWRWVRCWQNKWETVSFMVLVVVLQQKAVRPSVMTRRNKSPY